MFVTISERELQELRERSAELRSLQTELSSVLKYFYPKKDMPLNHKIFFAVRYLLDFREESIERSRDL